MKNLIGISGKIGSGKDTVASIMQYICWCEAVNSSDLPAFKEWCEGTELSSPVAGWEIKKFAAKLKQIVCLLTGCTMEDLESQEFKNKPLSEDWHKHISTHPAEITEAVINKYEVMTYRTMLQKIGTEAMRGQVHDQVWVNSLFADYKQDDVHYPLSKEQREFYNGQSGPVPGTDIRLEFPKWIISDMRFPNEMEAVKSRGGITIRIYRHKENHYDINNGEKPMIEHPSETALDTAEFDYTIDNNGTIEELIGKVEIILRELEII